MRSLITFAKYLFLVIIVVIIFGFSLWHNPKRDRFLIPERFTGTVYVYFQVPGAPPLEMEDGYRLIVIPDNGVVKTSSDLISGKLHDEYWLCYPNGERRRMPPDRIGGGGTVERGNSYGQKIIYFQFEVLRKK